MECLVLASNAATNSPTIVVIIFLKPLKLQRGKKLTLLHNKVTPVNKDDFLNLNG